MGQEHNRRWLNQRENALGISFDERFPNVGLDVTAGETAICLKAKAINVMNKTIARKRSEHTFE